MEDLGLQSLKILQIIWINIILSGDNAVVIALACRDLPAKQRRMGILLGTGVAVVLRIVFTIVVAQLLGVPFLRVVGGLLLFWIAVKLLAGDDAHGGEINSSDRLWGAVKTVAIADAVMSLDNVLAIVGVAGGNFVLLVLGLAISIPLVVVGASLITALLKRFPILVWAGAGLLGWVAGEMLVADPAVIRWLMSAAPKLVEPFPGDPAGVGFKAGGMLEHGVAALGVAFVLAVGWYMARRGEQHAAKPTA